MKKIVLLLAAALVAASCGKGPEVDPPVPPAPPKPVNVAFKDIPDEAFREWCDSQVRFWDTDGDDALSAAELAAVTSIDVSATGDPMGEIASMEGLHLFPGLTRLNCYNNKITTLDVSKNPALTYLACGATGSPRSICRTIPSSTICGAPTTIWPSSTSHTIPS